MADDAPVGGKKKIPVWIWAGGAAVLVAVIYFYRKNSANAAASAATTATTPTTTDTSGLATDQYEALLAQLRDVQGEESSEAPGPAGPAGPTGPPGTPGVPVAIATPMPNPIGNPAPVTPTAPPVKTAPPPAKPRTVTVAAYPAWNSTLWGIAQREYGSGTQDTKIWNANQALIEGQEIKHGMSKAQADQRKWLYPGEVLTIP